MADTVAKKGGDEDFFAELENQFKVRMCESREQCLGLFAGKWYLRFSCPGCAEKGIPTEQRNIVPILCCSLCADLILGTVRKTCTSCGWSGVGHGRVLVAGYVNAEGRTVVGSDLGQITAIMDSTPEYVLGEDDDTPSEEEGEL